jgi:hypothetical protein
MTTLINEHYIKPQNNIPIDKIHELFKIENHKEFKPWNFSLIKTYEQYIKPYRFAIIVFVVFGIFLLIKYHLKKSRKKFKNKKINKKINKKTFKIKYDEPNINNDDVMYNHNDVISVDDLKSYYSQDDEILNDDYLNNDNNDEEPFSETMKNELTNIKNSKYMFNHLAKLMTG